ncbi:MAG: hypothetical protein V4503_10050 [Gemmatimonadota bacterium]
MQPPFDLSVILAEAIDNPGLDRSLAAINCACAGIPTEVLVVRPSGRPPLPASDSLTLREIAAGESTPVPDRWGLGVAAAQAPIFACLTTELEVYPDWARAVLAALRDGVVGTAGTIALKPGAGRVASAVYFVRFNAFLPQSAATSHAGHNIPGDTGVYRREAVMAYPELLSEGFWEADFHRRFRAEGKPLRLLDQPLAFFDTAIGLRAAMKLRAHHARGFGETRVARYGESAYRLLLAAPLVPVVLLLRILRRAAGSRGAFGLAIRVLPALTLLCAAWGWGEATGAVAARRSQ